MMCSRREADSEGHIEAVRECEYHTQENGTVSVPH